MATQEQIDELTRLFAEARPQQVANQQQRQRGWAATGTGTEGMLGVLIYLYRNRGTVTAGMVSKALGITTGRVSVLIKKMEQRGLVIRERGAEDARVTEIRLTDKGRKVVDDLQEQRTAQMKRLIDTVGMVRLREYVRTSAEVWSILTPLSVDL